MKKLLALLVVGGLLALATGCPPAPTPEATPKKDNNANPNTPKEPPPPLKGKLTKVEAGKVMVNDKEVVIPDGAKISVDGKDVKDLKDFHANPDATATVTYDKDSKIVSVAIDNKPPMGPPEPTKGKVTKIEGGKIMVADKEITIPEGAKIMVDDKEVKDLKEVKSGPDTTATVTYDKDGKVATVAIEKPAPTAPMGPPEPLKGKVTKIEGGKITVADKEVVIPDGAKITVDGKEVKNLNDVKSGADTTATVTYDKDSKITAVEVVKPAPAGPMSEAPKPLTGKLTKIDGNKLTIGDKEITIPDNVKITLDGKDVKELKDVKPTADTTATVTTDKDGKITTVEIKTKP